MKEPLVSIITVSCNSEKTIEETILSVLNQTYSNIQYIVIDAASTDKTKQIISKYKNRINKYISEKDRGIFDGMNKGMLIADGDIITFLNSDDWYIDKEVVNRAIKAILNSDSDASYGDLIFFSDNNAKKILIRKWRPGNFSIQKIKWGWHIPHPTLFVKRSALQEVGNFDLSFPIASDYDLMTRLFLKEKIKAKYVPHTQTMMRLGGNSNRFWNKIKAWGEIYRIFNKNKMKPPILLLISRFILFHLHSYLLFSKEISKSS